MVLIGQTLCGSWGELSVYLRFELRKSYKDESRSYFSIAETNKNNNKGVNLMETMLASLLGFVWRNCLQIWVFLISGSKNGQNWTFSPTIRTLNTYITFCACNGDKKIWCLNISKLGSIVECSWMNTAMWITFMIITM